MLTNLTSNDLNFAYLTNHVNKLTVIGPMLSEKFDVIECGGALLCITFQLDSTLLPMLHSLLVRKTHLTCLTIKLSAIKGLHCKSIYILDYV